MEKKKDWEKDAPVCNNCKKSNRWLSLARTIRTGREFYMCECGNEQEKLTGQEANIDAIENDPKWGDL